MEPGSYTRFNEGIDGSDGLMIHNLYRDNDAQLAFGRNLPKRVIEQILLQDIHDDRERIWETNSQYVRNNLSGGLTDTIDQYNCIVDVYGDYQQCDLQNVFNTLMELGLPY